MKKIIFKILRKLKIIKYEPYEDFGTFYRDKETGAIYQKNDEINSGSMFFKRKSKNYY